MSPEECIERVRTARPRVTVIGDYLLDGWWNGSAERVAREAPAPVVHLIDRTEAPGGSANTALNLAALGARARAVGVVGADDAAAELRAQLSAAGVDVSDLAGVAGASTTTKVRVTVDDHVLLRLDQDRDEAWPLKVREEFCERAERAVKNSDALLVCDYGSTLLDDFVVERLARMPRPALIVVDAHRPGRWRDLRPDIVTPNAAEAETLPGVSLGSGDERAQRAIAATETLLEATGAATVAVTLDRTGTVLLRRDGDPVRTYAEPAPERHASGAGDVFAAAITTARAAGVSLEDAATFAQGAASVAVQRAGTCVCSIEELGEWFSREAEAVRR
ncbi:bifunctional heptose 7-phosphate kinase/heptose 1-phosphate adenyltransferase [Leucobacter tenebrionis]|uniref:bifunctional heptose 7-phosphate kinase/heptose 1-phosphate adenyltransferase n=1 Tax=Leucobacter tenebrionis TaxID=2873270 RepID=UPI001CA67AE2|nr:PfkB family carbohydrate kinase [Leucobacter tenebrionis]QZY51806.1 bifunctional hydroxymethylpyrimidine kinase/phosphomethylpyrimidine kinase [Leucobacter tenebrionis]